MTKVKVLFLAADPLSAGPRNPSPRLRIDDEIREIQQKVWASEHRDSLEIASRWAVRADDVLQALNEVRPHVVHFSGHGSEAGDLILVGKDGTPRAVTGEALRSLFRTLKDEIRVVLFNACYTQALAEGISEVIDCTIGMSRVVSDHAAIEFAASFYRALGFGRSVREAFDQGTSALLMEGIPEEGTPRLSVRQGVDPGQVKLVGAPNGHPLEPTLAAGTRSVRAIGGSIAIGGDVINSAVTIYADGRGAPAADQKGPPSPAAFRESRNAYLDRVIVKHGRITLPAFGGNVRQTEVNLEKLFVGLRGEITTRSQRVAQAEHAADLRAGQDFDEAGYLATHRHAREMRNAGELLAAAAPLNFAQAIKVVAWSDFRLVILGDPGSGKTTISRWLAIKMAAALKEDRDALAIPRSDLFPDDLDPAGPPVVIPGTRLPVLIRVSKYAEALLRRPDEGADLHAYILDHVLGQVPDERRHPALRRCVEEMDREGRLLVILDGLDELPDAMRVHHDLGTPRWKQRIRQTVLEQIRDLAEAFRPGTDAEGMPVPRNALLVTSRIKGYDFHSLLPGELTHLTIEPMSRAERRQFFVHWTRAVVEGGPEAGRELERAREQFCTVLQREIDDDRRLGREVTTPQITGLVASVALSSWHSLPEAQRSTPESLGRLLPRSRTEIYGRVVDLLLERWRSDRYWGSGTTDAELARLVSEPGQLRRVLKEVALAIHADPELQSGDVDGPRLARIVEAAARQLKIPWERACDTIETFTGFMIPLLAQHSGFMVQRTEGVFSFQHRSVQEYLAGCLLAEGNAPDGSHRTDWPELRGFLLNPQELIQWREVTWHGLAHLQLLNPGCFLRLAGECLAADAADNRPFPVTLLLLLEAAPTLPRADDPEFVRLLVRSVLLAFARNPSLREPLWPAFRAALLALPTEFVSAGLAETVHQDGAGLAAGAAEIVVRLGAFRPMTEWTSPALVGLLIRARDLDAEALSWPIHRCLALVLTACEGWEPLEQVPELAADRGRAGLARPECQAALTSDPAFARKALALTGCIDCRDSVYLWQYVAFARFLGMENAARDRWLPFLQDYWGGGDSIYGIAVHLDSDFGRAGAGARIPPSLKWQYALSVNPNVSPAALPASPVAPADWRALLDPAWTWFFRLSSDERFLLLIAESGADVVGLSMQASNHGLIRLVRQRALLLEDGIHRGVPLLLRLVQRTGAGTGKTAGELALWRIALKAMVRALGSGGVGYPQIAALRQLSSNYQQNGAQLAEWWVFACNGLLTDEWADESWYHDDGKFVEVFGDVLQDERSWLHALYEVPTAGALSHRRSQACVPVESYYPHLPQHYDADDLPFHTLSVFTRAPWHTLPVVRRLGNGLLPRLEAALPAVAAECRAIRWMMEGPAPGAAPCFGDPSLAGLEERILETATAIDSPFHRARFLVRMLPYAPPDALVPVRSALSAVLGEVGDPHPRLLVLEQLHRATLELFHENRAGEAEVAEVERQWQAALVAVTDPVHRALAATRAVFACPREKRGGLLLQAVEFAGEILDVLVRAEVLRELLPLASLVSAARKKHAKLARSIAFPAWRSWARGRDGGAFSWLGGRVEPGTSEFAAFTALHTRVLLQESLTALGADHGQNAIELWKRCLRGEVPVGELVSLGRIEAFDLTPVVALALDELLHGEGWRQAVELLPLCVNPAPQALAVASRWAAHADPRVAGHGRLLCAEIQGHVHERSLAGWTELLEDPDDRTRFRASQCIRHPLVVPRWRRQRFSRLGLSWLLAWDQALQAAMARGSAGASELSWLSHDFVADSRVGLQQLIGLAKEDSSIGESARRIISSFEILDQPSWECLVRNLSQETDPAMQDCLLEVVFRAAHRGSLTVERLEGVREALGAPALAGLCERRYFVPATGDYLAVFQALWEAGRGAPVDRSGFIEAIEARCQLRVGDLVQGTREDFERNCSRVALSRYYLGERFVMEFSGQVETRWAIAGLEFFLEWFCAQEPRPSRASGARAGHGDHLLHVAAVISARIPSLIRGNVRLPDGLEARLREVVRDAGRWADRVAAMELLGSISSATPALLESLVRGVMDGPVRTTAFDAAARMRDVDHDFIEHVIARLDDESGVVAYAMGRVLKNACLHGATTPDDRHLIIRALTRAKDGERSRRTVYFEHHSRTNLPQLPRLDQHFARMLAEIWLGDQAITLQQSRSGWTGPPSHPIRTEPSPSGEALAGSVPDGAE